MALVACDGTRTYEGRVVSEWERNGYHDSDFFCVVWEGEGAEPEFRTVEFATTRGHCGAAYGTSVDASEELKARYRTWEREAAAAAAKAVHDKDVEDLVHAGVDAAVAEAFVTEFPWSMGSAISTYRTGRRGLSEIRKRAARKLLTTNLRSKFRISLRDHLVTWLTTPVADRKYGSPFSDRQWDALTRYER